MISRISIGPPESEYRKRDEELRLASEFINKYADAKLPYQVRAEAAIAGLYEMINVKQWQAFLDCIPGPRYFFSLRASELDAKTVREFRELDRRLSRECLRHGATPPRV